MLEKIANIGIRSKFVKNKINFHNFFNFIFLKVGFCFQKENDIVVVGGGVFHQVVNLSKCAKIAYDLLPIPKY